MAEVCVQASICKKAQNLYSEYLAGLIGKGLGSPGELELNCLHVMVHFSSKGSLR